MPAFSVRVPSCDPGEHCAIVHKRVVPLAEIFTVSGLFYEGENCVIPYFFSVRKEEMKKYAPDIRFNEWRGDVICERENRARGALAYAGKRKKRFAVFGKFSTVAQDDRLSYLFKRECPPVVSEPLPRREHLSHRRARKCAEVREPPEERWII